MEEGGKRKNQSWRGEGGASERRGLKMQNKTINT